MAASYWDSTQHRHWTFSKEQLADMREQLEMEEPNLVQMFPLPQWRHLYIYFSQQIARLAKRLSLRQQILATAQHYVKRFYLKVEIRRTNPYLVMMTAFYLACKTEESPQHIRMMVNEIRASWPDTLGGLDVSSFGECEFYLISEMRSQLIIHQPYRTLAKLQSDFSLSQDEINACWSVINDHFMTDLPLLYPPYIIALTAILLALVLRVPPGQGNVPNMAAATAALAQAHAGRGFGGSTPGGSRQNTPGAGPEKDKQLEAKSSKLQRFAMFLSESQVDIEAMVDCTQEIISFYECFEQYNDKTTRDQLTRIVKARALDQMKR